jgi:hypothetical protein
VQADAGRSGLQEAPHFFFRPSQLINNPRESAARSTRGLRVPFAGSEVPVPVFLARDEFNREIQVVHRWAVGQITSEHDNSSDAVKVLVACVQFPDPLQERLQ